MAFTTVISFKMPDGHAGFIKSVDQALESLAAYEDCELRLFYRGEDCPWWRPGKPEVTPVSIALWEEEVIELQIENSGLITHYCAAEFTGYYFNLLGKGKSQRGMRLNIGLPAGAPV